MCRSQPWRTNRSRVFASATGLSRSEAVVRDRRLGDLKFVRQAPVGAYFVDFLCRERKIVVEVDGGTHGTDAEIADDAARTAELKQLGYRVFRVSNRDVYDDVERVLDALFAFVEDGD